MQVELDDVPDELRRQEVRELRRQRLGEGGEVGAFVVLEATGVENPAEVRVVGEWPVIPVICLLWKLGAWEPYLRVPAPVRAEE